jgi:hypothetical protein
MDSKTYKKKTATAKVFADRFIKRTESYYHKILKRDSNPNGEPDSELIRMYCKDLADSLLVCYLVKAEDFIEAHDTWYNMDTDPRDIFPNGLCDLLGELSHAQYKTEKSGYRKV